jgi:hypothetical protein
VGAGGVPIRLGRVDACELQGGSGEVDFGVGQLADGVEGGPGTDHVGIEPPPP